MNVWLWTLLIVLVIGDLQITGLFRYKKLKEKDKK